MFGIEFVEIAIILIVALLVFGPERLPEMAKQAATFVRDLRRMVANARRDVHVSASDLGIDEEDLRTLRELRNPRAFVRDKVLDGVELQDLGLDDDEGGPGSGSARRDGSSRRNGAAARDGTARRGGAASGSGARRSDKPAADLPYDPEAT
ncbi:MAG: twin-arginine translocase TatA/TatE family subunit [Actinomycetota bacterium]